MTPLNSQSLGPVLPHNERPDLDIWTSTLDTLKITLTPVPVCKLRIENPLEAAEWKLLLDALPESSPISEMSVANQTFDTESSALFGRCMGPDARTAFPTPQWLRHACRQAELASPEKPAEAASR